MTIAKKLGFVLFLFTLSVFCCGMGDIRNHTEELSTLKDQAKEEAGKEGELARQQKSFENVSAAINNGRLKKGMSSRQVQDLYGKAEVASPDGAGRRWLYFARSKQWLKTPRIELYFDKNNLLTGWECAYADCRSNVS